MTGDSPVPDRPALWAALSTMQIEEPGTGRRFEEALAERQGWTLDFAGRVADEYLGFLYLAATAGFEVTPSATVDEAWHLHLEWPHYREILCGSLLGRTLEHRPGTGEPEDEARCRWQYEETLALYEQVFGRPPPADIWPRPTAATEEEDDSAESSRDWARRLSRRLAFISLVGSVAALPFGAPGYSLALLGAALILFLLGQPAVASPRGSKAGGNCGGGCAGGGSGWGSSDGDGCAGCGGGCGGD